MGSMAIQGADLEGGKEIKDWYPLMGKKSKPAGKIFVKVHFKPFNCTDMKTNVVAIIILPIRTGCQVKRNTII